MSLRTAQENFKKAFEDKDKSLTEKFLAELKAYVTVKAESKKQRYIIMKECMDNNEMLASFKMRNDVCDDMVEELLKRNIPFIIVTNRAGEYGFIIRSADRAITNEAIKEVLKKLGNYCEILTGEELITNVQKQKDRDKGLLAINGLTLQELKLLEKLCKKEGFLQFIAEDEMSDGTFRFMVYGKQAAADFKFAQILFTMIMMTEGSNKETNKKRIANEIKVQKLRANNFGRASGIKSPIYILGSGNQFMKIEQNAFSFGYAIKESGQVKIVEQFAANSSNPSFNSYEKTYLNRIPDPAATTNISQVMEHFARTYNEKDSLDFGMTQDERNRFFGETVLINSILKVVSNHVIYDDIMNVSGRWLEKTGHVSFEAGKLLNGVINNEVPVGYEPLDIQEVKTNISEYDLNLNDYKTVSENLRGVIITNEKGTLEIKGSIDERVEEMHEQYMESRNAEEQELSEDRSAEVEYSESIARS